MFANIKIPVVLVSSAYPLENVKANGVDNFYGAVEFIKSGSDTGVYVSYKNISDNKVNIHAGTRVIAHMEASADVFSVDNNPYAFCENGKIVLNKEYMPGKVSDHIKPIEFCAYPRILVVDCHPGDEFSYNPENYNAIILVPYHSATLNTQNDKFKSFLGKANKKDIPVFLINVPSGEQYETTKIYKELNINVLTMCSKSAIYMKCWIAVSLDKNIKEFVEIPLAQEFVEKGDIK
jgi:L-asparaginase